MSEHDTNQRARWIRDTVGRYEGQLVRYAARITGDSERARDVVQDTFLKLCSQDRQRIEGHLAEWLFTVCRNRAFDVRRKEKRMQSITAGQAAAQLSREKDQTAAVAQRHDADHVFKLLESLSEEQQEVIRMKFQNGLSYRQISRVTQLSVSNVGFLIHTGIQKIRKQLQVDTA